MNEPQLKFCRLCGKSKPEKDFIDIPLAMISDRKMLMCAGCKSCATVVHNIRTIIRDAEEKIQKLDEKASGEMEKVIEERKAIVIPSVMVPGNIKN